MLGAVRTGLETVSGHGGWRCALVGGGRRSSAVHDAGVCVCVCWKGGCLWWARARRHEEACCAAGCPCCWHAQARPAGNASASMVPLLTSADVLVTHPEQPTEEVILLLRDHFVAEGRLIPPEKGMCRWEARHTSVTVPCFESKKPFGRAGAWE